MKTPLTIALLAVFAAGAATAQMPPDRPRLDSYVAVARHHAARQFQIPPQNLWFSELQLDYNRDWLADDSADAPRQIVVTFFDPASVKPDADNARTTSADGYAVALSPDGESLGRAGHRKIGWSR